jgi:colicin import membrane protein
MTAKLVPTPPPPPPDREADPFRYGWRDVPRTQPDGSVTWERLPLSLEDVLHPQEGDVIPESTRHDLERSYVAGVCRAGLAGRRGSLVLSDCLIDWGLEDLRDHAPDIAPVLDVTDPERERGKFYVAREGTRPFLVVEIVSPDTRVNDVERKLEEYYRAGVPLYVIVDEEWAGAPRRLLAFRRTPRGYEAVPPDEHGRVLLEGVGIRLGLRENHLVCYDADTGAEVGDYSQVSQAHRREQEARQAAERRARAAEQREWEQAEARLAAEQRAREEAEARAAAEQRAREEAEARAAAEQRAHTAEERARQLEDDLRRLRGNDAT